MSLSKCSPPTPRYGRDCNVNISTLLDTKMIAQRWKAKLAKIRNQQGTLVQHVDSLKKPKILTLDDLESENAILMPIIGGRHNDSYVMQ